MLIKFRSKQKYRKVSELFEQSINVGVVLVSMCLLIFPVSLGCPEDLDYRFIASCLDDNMLMVDKENHS